MQNSIVHNSFPHIIQNVSDELASFDRIVTFGSIIAGYRKIFETISSLLYWC